jgi:hypothetical protein
LTLREEHRLRVFEYRFPREIFRSKRDEIIGRWRKLHNQVLHNVYFSANIIRIIKSRRKKWAGKDSTCSTPGEKGNAYRIWWEIQKQRDH